MTADTDETWDPTAILRPGPCPPHLHQAMRDAIQAGRAAEAERLRIIRQREENK